MAIEKVINIKVNSNDAVKDLDKIKKSIDGANDSQEDLNNSADKLGGSYSSSVASAKKQVDKLGDSLKETSTEATKAGKSIDEVSSNGGAIAILDQLTGGLATRFKDAYEATKLFNFSLKGTKTALLATGIGAIVIAVGALIAYWDEIEELISGTNRKLQEQIDLTNKNLDNLSFEVKLIEAKEKLLIAEGKSTKGIKLEKEKILLLQAEQNRLLLDSLQTQLEKEKLQIKEVSYWDRIKVATLNAVGAYEKAGKVLEEANFGDEEELERLAGVQKQLEDAQIRALELKTSLALLNQPTETEGGQTTETDTERDDYDPIQLEKDRLKELSDFKKELEKQDEDYYAQTEEEKLELERERKQAELDALIASETEKREAQRVLNEYYDQLELDLENKKYAEKEALRQKNDALQKKSEEDELKRKQILAKQQTSLTVNALGDLSSALAGASEESKGFAVANALINTYQGISAGVALGYPAAIPAVAAAALIGFQSVSDILSTKTDGSGASASTNTPAVTSSSFETPSFNLVEGTGTNQIAEAVAGESQPIKAYVVSGEMSTQQEIDRNIEDNAKI